MITLHKTLRFALVGVLNTLVNFAILNICFYEIGLNKIASNIVATCLALLMSFILNRNFVFAHRGAWHKQFLSFAIVTVIGTLVLNNTIYALCLNALKYYAASLSHTIHGMGPHISANFILINGSAVIATIFSMIWNYNWYQRVVFRGGSK